MFVPLFLTGGSIGTAFGQAVAHRACLNLYAAVGMASFISAGYKCPLAAVVFVAEATGGRAFFPFKMKDMTHSFAAIEDELRSQYVVSYKPADFDADGRYRSIEISALKKDLQVRARKGYFAPPAIGSSLVNP